MRFLLPLALLALVSCADGNGENPPAATVPEDVARARELLDSGRALDAYRLLTPAVEKNPESVEHLVAFAEACQRVGRIPRGVRYAEKARSLDPDNARALYVSALLDRDRERLGDAMDRAREAVAADPEELEYRILLGDLAISASDHATAVATYRAAHEIAPDDPRIVGGLGRALVLSGENEEGLALLEEYLAERPHDGEAAYLAGLAQFRSGDYEAAEGSFREAIRAAPHLPSPYHNLARILQMTGRAEEAEAMRARHREVNERDWAIRSAKRRLAADPGDRAAGRELLRLLLDAGLHQEANEVRARLTGP